ncbi:glycosyltransferase family 2 protein [Pedobacter sp. AJM]|uniref:glycosyltransferase family 2 protein n=1 Tax=Pedobacter sp. AJM TaxID=2003629 RepID=UPI000B4BD6D7|nr:glycosyltransferase family 2 protein [Pedobacter sp. AJM]OWK71759.1 hypothetical protein CBW18_04625 [Pedobacter sp. AJM]
MPINIYPDFSIVVPCYQQAEYLNEALLSVQNQTFINWECIIVNDGSNDETEEIAEYWCKLDDRFLYIKQENRGLSNARNEGIKRALGSYILPLDADDKIGEHYLEKAFPFIENNEVKLVYCKAKKFGLENINWNLPTYSYSQLLIGNIIFCSAIFRKADFLLTSGYDESMKNGYEDWDFWLQFLSKEDKVHQLNSIEFFYRIKSSSMLKMIDENSSRVLRNIIFKKHINKYLIDWDPILEHREYNKIISMYKNSIDYKFGNFIFAPLRKIYYMVSPK